MNRDGRNNLLLKAAAVLLSGCVAAAVAAKELPHHSLSIRWDDREVVQSAEQLLRRPDIETVTLRDVSAYPRQEMTFRALKMGTLLRELGIEGDRNVQFIASDGFTANLEADLLRNTSGKAAIAYLAIEDPDDPWPPHRSGDGTAGPFYLFWLHPELSGIGREEWPYKFNRIVARDPLEKLYPEIVPADDAPGRDALYTGFQVFVKNCFTCHTLNGIGPGQMGPDLNHPMSPTEYFRDGILKQFVRNPQSVRANPRSPMGAFPPEMIADEDLEKLLAYLRYMANREKP